MYVLSFKHMICAVSCFEWELSRYKTPEEKEAINVLEWSRGRYWERMNNFLLFKFSCTELPITYLQILKSKLAKRQKL